MLPAIMAMVNWHIGAAIYTFPTIFSQFGVVASVLTLASCAVMTLVVYCMLNAASKGLPPDKQHFMDVVRIRLGPAASKTLSFLVVCNALGVFSSYFSVVRGIIDGLVSSSVARSLCEGTLLLVVVVIAASEKIDDIPFANELANLAVLVLILGLIMLPAQQDAGPMALPGHHSWTALFDVCIFSFSSAEVYMTLDARHRTNAVAMTSVALSFALYTLVGIAGMSVAGPHENIMHAFGTASVLGNVVVISNALSLVLSLPVFVVTARTYLERELPAIQKMKYWQSALLSILTAWFLQRLASGIIQLISFVSGFTDVTFMLVFPPLLALKSTSSWSEPWKVRSSCAWTFVLGGVCLILRTAWDMCEGVL